MTRIQRARTLPIRTKPRMVPIRYHGVTYMVDSRMSPATFRRRMQRGPDAGWPVERCCTEPPSNRVSRQNAPWEPMRLSARVSADQQAIIDAGRVRNP